MYLNIILFYLYTIFDIFYHNNISLTLLLKPCGTWQTKGDKELLSDSCNSLGMFITHGFIPLLHGDCVFDSDQGCTILSGDTICQVKLMFTRTETWAVM